VEDVPALVAAVAVPELFLRAYIKRRGVLGMERTKALPLASSSGQPDMAPDHVHDVESGLDLL
jgi:hypothetical protein